MLRYGHTLAYLLHVWPLPASPPRLLVLPALLSPSSVGRFQLLLWATSLLRDFCVNCSFFYSFYVLATLSSIWDFSSPTRDWTLAPSPPAVEAESLTAGPLGLFVLVQLLSRVRLFATPWTAARQASLSITNSRSLLKLVSIESVMPSNQLILCRPLLLLPSIFPGLRVFSNESVLRIRWPKYWMAKEVPETIVSVWNILPLCFSFLFFLPLVKAYPPSALRAVSFDHSSPTPNTHTGTHSLVALLTSPGNTFLQSVFMAVDWLSLDQAPEGWGLCSVSYVVL